MKKFDYKQFNKLDELIQIKNKKSLTIGLGLPILNEEKTITGIIKTVNSCKGLIDKVIAIDSGSTDGSIGICKDFGINIISDINAAKKLKVELHRGKGFNLWASVYLLNTDIIIWIDTDIKNISKKFITGLAGPLILDDNLKFIKGYYQRSKNGARVTEILVRPFTNILWPELNELIQPLSGEYGGRIDFFKKINFYSGYSVEMAINLQAVMLLKNYEIAQSNLGKRIHKSQSISALGKMGASILRTSLELSKQYNRLDFDSKVISDSMKKFSYNEEKKYFNEEVVNIKDNLLLPLKLLVKNYKNDQ